MVNLSFVKPKNKLKQKAFKSELISEIVKKLLNLKIIQH